MRLAFIAILLVVPLSVCRAQDLYRFDIDDRTFTVEASGNIAKVQFELDSDLDTMATQLGTKLDGLHQKCKGRISSVNYQVNVDDNQLLAFKMRLSLIDSICVDFPSAVIEGLTVNTRVLQKEVDRSKRILSFNVPAQAICEEKKLILKLDPKRLSSRELPDWIVNRIVGRKVLESEIGLIGLAEKIAEIGLEPQSAKYLSCEIKDVKHSIVAIYTYGHE
ncbi:MAG: hypothetical protein U1E45_24685 [Geminicoccaceae bacterium]